MDADWSGRDEVPGTGPGTNRETCDWLSTAKPGDEQICLKEHVERLTGDAEYAKDTMGN